MIISAEEVEEMYLTKTIISDKNEDSNFICGLFYNLNYYTFNNKLKQLKDKLSKHEAYYLAVIQLEDR